MFNSVYVVFKSQQSTSHVKIKSRENTNTSPSSKHYNWQQWRWKYGSYAFFSFFFLWLIQFVCEYKPLRLRRPKITSIMSTTLAHYLLIHSQPAVLWGHFCLICCQIQKHLSKETFGTFSVLWAYSFCFGSFISITSRNSRQLFLVLGKSSDNPTVCYLPSTIK